EVNYSFDAPKDDTYYVYLKGKNKPIGEGRYLIIINFAEIGKEISEEGDLSSGLTRDQIEKQAVKDQFNVWFGRILGENYSPMKGIWVKIGKGTKFSPKITNEYGLVSFKLKPNKKYEITFQVSDKTIIKKSARYTKTPEGKTVYFFERYRESIEQSGSIIPEDKTFEISINPNEKEGIIVKVFNSKNKEVSVNFQGDWGQDDEEFSIFEFNAPYGRYLIHVELEGYKSRDKKIKFNKITNDIVMYLKKK
ncbi:hypothetical protein HQ529_03985, partial [Candidatus Woesearchaeota archaeon]|nr:hypothetical protein [Candidatus Woesearchaeota archaeon]